jgi:hypothetical protein
LTLLEFLENGVAFRLPHPLQHDLLGGLGRDPAELRGHHAHFHHFAQFGVRFDPPRLFQGDFVRGFVNLLHDHLL